MKAVSRESDPAKEKARVRGAPVHPGKQWRATAYAPSSVNFPHPSEPRAVREKSDPRVVQARASTGRRSLRNGSRFESARADTHTYRKRNDSPRGKKEQKTPRTPPTDGAHGLNEKRLSFRLALLLPRSINTVLSRLSH
ncbi:hypothetical protein MRX96_043409 [Rhipicephalus microplus]